MPASSAKNTNKKLLKSCAKKVPDWAPIGSTNFHFQLLNSKPCSFHYTRTQNPTPLRLPQIPSNLLPIVLLLSAGNIGGPDGV